MEDLYKIIELIKTNESIRMFFYAGIGIFVYRFILIVLRIMIIRCCSSENEKKYLQSVKIFEKFVVVYVPPFLFGVLNYVIGVDKVGLTNEFMASGLVLLMYEFFNKVSQLGPSYDE